MKRFFRQNAVFLSLSLVLLIALGLALLCIPKGELHLLLCDRHTHARDIFYRNYTHVAEWLPYILCLLVLLFGRAGNAAMAASCIAGSELTTQILKRIAQAPRPVTWFADKLPDIQLPLVEGVRMNQWLSFPSGHTTSFFALFFALTIITTGHLAAQKTTNRTSEAPKESDSLYELIAIAVQLLFFALAALGGYSRIYLSQHFALDVFAGIAVGLTISTLLYVLFSRWKDQKWYNYRIFAKK